MMNSIGSPTSSSQFQFTSAKQKRIYSRLQLLGRGPASFYFDACRLMSLEPPLFSTTHIVSHLLREIESAFRAIVISASGKTINVKSQSKHRESIEIVLNFLEIPLNSEIGNMWLSLPDEDYGLHARAHRAALAYRPANTEFTVFWEGMENVLDTVLLRFEEKYLSAHQLIHQLMSITNPTQDDLKRLRNDVPNSPSAMREFFNSANVVWLELLKPYFFKLPPEIDPIENSFAPWPESQFLVRAARSNPESVLEIFLSLPHTDNPFVLDDLCDIALKLPIETTLQVLPKVKLWLASQYQRLLPIKIAELVKRLAENKKINEALELSYELLAVLPEPDVRPSGWREIRSRYQPFFYNEMLDEYLIKLTEIAPVEFALVLSRLINDAINSLTSGEANLDVRDPSYLWSIFSQEHHIDDIEDVLVRTLYKTSLNAINDDQNNLVKIVQIFEIYPWAIFKRLSLYFLSQYPAVSQPLYSKYLMNRELFENYSSEYRLLLQSGFTQLDSSKQDDILTWFKDIPDKDDDWQLHWLSAIKDALPPLWKSRYEELVLKLGIPQTFAYHAPIETQAWWGDGSPKTSDQLLALDISDLIEYLSSWRPPNDFLGKNLQTRIRRPAKNYRLNVPRKICAGSNQIYSSLSDIHQFLSLRVT